MRILRYGVVMLFLVSLWGCSKVNDNGTIMDASGKHPANWIVNHREAFRKLAGANDDPAIAGKSQCVECHGSDLKGGIAKVSCFSQGNAAQSCHFHPAGYRNGDNHGAVAKDFGASAGFRTCQGCHGSRYASGVFAKTSCFAPASLSDSAFACHGVSAPHAREWATSSTRQHSSTDPNNAAECAQCHSGGENLTNLPPPPAQPAGTAPGCFNNTLCHSGLHPIGWIAPAQHGAAAKSQPGTGAGFNSCQTCHGTDFKGGASKVSCFSASSPNGSCHLRNGAPANSPHAALPWRAAAPAPSHTSTVDDEGKLNARVCAQCHLKGANLRTAIISSYTGGTPGCFNSTLCHGVVGHPAGWADPSQHGATAKANLTFCQTCHSNNPGGGPGSIPRFNVVLGRLTAGCETCHQVNTAHPPVIQIPAAFGIVSPDPLGTPWFRHRTATSFDACNRCHGATLQGGVGPRCQNCHVAASPLSTIGSPDPCRSCHSQPPSGTVYPNINEAHSNHLIVNVAAGSLCNECHLGFGSGTLAHFNKAKLQPVAQIASMAFGTFSRTGGLVPAYNSTNQQCTSTYCHGNAMPRGDTTGTNRSPIWSAATYPPVLSAAFCGQCHGFPPTAASGHPVVATPAGFPVGNSCSCHANINAAGNSYANIFVRKALHINGILEPPGHSFPFGGSVHRPGGTGTPLADPPAPYANCSGCHDTTTEGGTYPVAPGVKPLCSACHLNMASFTGPNPGCGDCHGVSIITDPLTNGRPNGVNFPNKAGKHINVGAHTTRSCVACHPFTAGDARHGWSGGVRSTVAQVPPTGFLITTWNPANRTCTASCHIGAQNEVRTW